MTQATQAAQSAPRPHVLTLVAGPASLLGVRETLRDWSAGGLVSDFVWVPVEGQDQNHAGFRISSGGLELLKVPQLAGQHRYDKIRVVALSSVSATAADPAAEYAQVTRVGDELRRLAANEFGNSPVEALRITCPDPQVQGAVDLADSAGWVDVIVTPTESRGPGVGSSPIALDSAAAISTHIAAQVAALAALWEEVDQAAFDGTGAASTGFRARLVRSFYRRLDGGLVENDVRARVFDVKDGYPLPVAGGNPCVPVDNEQGAIAAAADSVWRKHGWVLRSGRREPMPAKPEDISVGKALKMFFAFIWAAVRGAPSAWAKGLVDSTKAAVAATVHRAVFGSGESAFNVVVDGIGADGRPAGWQEQVQAADALQNELAGTGQTPHEDLSELWRTYTRTSFTLLDGLPRERDLPPLYAGARTAVVGNPAAIAGDPARPFTLQGSTAGALGQVSVAPADVMTAQEVGTQIQRLTMSNQAQNPDAAGQMSQMTDWYNSQQGSLTNRIGIRLADELTAVRAEVGDRLRSLSTGNDEADNGEHEIAEEHRILGVKMRILAGCGVAMALLFALLAYATAFPWWLFWVLFGVTVLGGVGGAFALFMRTQTRLFQIIHRREKATDDAQVDRDNLQFALRDLTRLGDAYGQYLHWAQVVGAFVHRPFGAAPAPAAGGHGRFDDLPPSTGHAAYLIDGEAAAQTARALRSEMFDAGWMDNQWRAYLHLSARAAELSDPRLVAEPERLFGESGFAERSNLSLLARAAQRPGHDTTLSAGWWNNARQRLAGPRHAQIRARLLGQVEAATGHTGPDAPAACQAAGDFVGEVGQYTTQEFGRPEMLDDSLLTDDGAARGAHRLEDNGEFIVGHESGFGQVVVHTQASTLVRPDDLRMAGRETAQPDEDHKRGSGASGAESPFGGEAF